MSGDIVVDNIVSFLMAGYDTTALALTWTLYLVSQNPEWERRMLDEIEQVVGDGPVTSDHVEKLKTVQQVLNESLRLFPTAPVIIRDINEDVEFNGTVIPRGTIGIIPIYAIHRHGKYWDDPHRFDPGPVCERGSLEADAVSVHAVRGGPEDMHRSRVCDARADDHARHLRAGRAL